KNKDTNNYYGQLADLDVAGGKSTALAQVAFNTDFFIDMSPDSKKALFVAIRADKAGADVEKANERENKLYELDVDGKTTRVAPQQARYAIYSPSGKQVLLGTPPEGFSMETLKLEITDSALNKGNVIAGNAHMPMAIGGVGDLQFQ